MTHLTTIALTCCQGHNVMRDRILSLFAHGNDLCTLDRSCPHIPSAFLYDVGHKFDEKFDKDPNNAHTLAGSALSSG